MWLVVARKRLPTRFALRTTKRYSSVNYFAILRCQIVRPLRQVGDRGCAPPTEDFTDPTQKPITRISQIMVGTVTTLASVLTKMA